MESTYPIVPLGEVSRPIAVTAQQKPASVLTFKGLRASGRLDLLPPAAGRFAAAQHGDVIFTKQGHVGGWVMKKVGLVKATHGDAVHVASTLQTLRPTPRILPAWLYLWLSAPSTYDLVQELVGGRNSITGPVLASIPVPLPPLEEQRRTVEALEYHFSRLDKADGSLASASKRSEGLARDSRHRLWTHAEAAGGLVRIADLGKVVTGATPQERHGDEVSAAQGFLTPADIGSGGEILSTARSFPASAIGRARSSAGSAAYAVCIGATLGKTGWSTDPLGFNQQINAVMTADAQEAALLAALMSAPAFQAQMWAGASATTMPILNKGRVLTPDFRRS